MRKKGGVVGGGPRPWRRPPSRTPDYPVAEEQLPDVAAGVVLRGAVAQGHQGRPRTGTSSPSTCPPSLPLVRHPSRRRRRVHRRVLQQTLPCRQSRHSCPHLQVGDLTGKGCHRAGFRRTTVSLPSALHRPDRQVVGAVCSPTPRRRSVLTLPRPDALRSRRGCRVEAVHRLARREQETTDDGAEGDRQRLADQLSGNP